MVKLGLNLKLYNLFIKLYNYHYPQAFEDFYQSKLIHFLKASAKRFSRPYLWRFPKPTAAAAMIGLPA